VFAPAGSSWLSERSFPFDVCLHCFDELEGLNYMVDGQNILSICKEFDIGNIL
jgi:hypothetical protein